ncbi:MAG: DegV family protein [Ardenticatenia bacterium]|nr:DegV family protein [Ardenticatenia bacterium]
MVTIVTDSAANLPAPVVRELDITVVPLTVIFGDQSYREGVDITPEQFYNLLRTSPVFPSTSQPSPQDFVDVFRPILDRGEEVLCVTISRELSGTYNSAVQAQAMLSGAPITVVDSQSASAGQALLVVAAARATRAGATRAEAAEVVRALRQELLLLFTLDTLEYLQRGGRIGRASAFVGTMLRIKPILRIQGVVEPFDRVRRRQRALERMIEAVTDRYGDRPVWVGLAHGDAEEEFHELGALLEHRFNIQYLLKTVVGPVVGAHGGPGVIGLAVMPEPDIPPSSPA